MTVTTPRAAIELDQVALAYGDTPVLRQLSLRVTAGEVYALLGSNGAGKSTTLSVLLGFSRARGGTVRIGGIDPAADPDSARRRIAYLSENVALYDYLSGMENADYLLSLAGDAHDRESIARALAAAGLQEDAWDRRLGGYSKGMRQKVAIAVALLRAVPVLLLDEPTSGLDPQATADFNRLIRTARDRGTAVLMVTHDLLSATDVADRIGFLDAGRIVEEVTASGPDRFDVRALHARFAVRAAA